MQTVTDNDILSALGENGNYRQRTADALGVTYSCLRYRIEKMRARGFDVPEPPPYGVRVEAECIPTPAEVARRIAEVQSQWSDEERERRAAPAYRRKRVEYDRCTMSRVSLL